jgi:peptide/nickel transport system substrate-binding protein
MRAVLAAGLFAVLAATPAPAANLIIGRAAEQSSIDPQFAGTGPNGDTASEMFDRLIDSDAHNQLHPALATAWTAVDPLTWRITLRDDVKFHDGSPFTADDVAFSLARAKAMPNSPAPFSRASRGVASVTVTGPHSLEVKTTVPVPRLMEQIGEIYILSHRAAAGMTTADMNSGKGMVGTGPYMFRHYDPASRVEMVANPRYWGRKPAWDHVTLRFIKQPGARVAALLAGDVDVIDQVPPSDARTLAANPKLSVFSIATTRLVYLALDSARATSPFITDSAGRKLDRNPLQDARVRRALSLMIDRKALANRLLDGSAEPAGQFVPEGLGGYDPKLTPPAVDVAGAKKLLAEAGYPKGFGLTLHSSNDRLPQDSAVAQALGQMFMRAGLRVNGVVTQPYNVYAAAASRGAYSIFLYSFGTTSASSADGLTSVLATHDPAHGMGAFNRARYSNPAFDALLGKALGEFDAGKRNAELAAATDIAINDGAIVPLYWQVAHWATRKGLVYAPRRDEATSARYVAAAH